MAGQATITTTNGKRAFACYPIAILVFIVDEQERILMLAHPQRQGGWEVINGAMEAEETILQGALRETAEEAGPGIRVRPLGTVHVQNFHYDEAVRYMFSVSYLMAYEGGEVIPGDDMQGSEYRWWSIKELEDEDIELLVPPNRKWIARRAIELYRLWKDQTVDLQPNPDEPDSNKYTRQRGAA